MAWTALSSELSYLKSLHGPNVLLWLNLAYFAPSLPVAVFQLLIDPWLNKRYGAASATLVRQCSTLPVCFACCAALPFLPWQSLPVLIVASSIIGTAASASFGSSSQLVARFPPSCGQALALGFVSSGPIVLLLQFIFALGSHPTHLQQTAFFAACAAFPLAALACTLELVRRYWTPLQAGHVIVPISMIHCGGAAVRPRQEVMGMPVVARPGVRPLPAIRTTSTSSVAEGRPGTLQHRPTQAGSGEDACVPCMRVSGFMPQPQAPTPPCHERPSPRGLLDTSLHSRASTTAPNAVLASQHQQQPELASHRLSLEGTLSGAATPLLTGSAASMGGEPHSPWAHEGDAGAMRSPTPPVVVASIIQQHQGGTQVALEEPPWPAHVHTHCSAPALVSSFVEPPLAAGCGHGRSSSRSASLGSADGGVHAERAGSVGRSDSVDQPLLPERALSQASGLQLPTGASPPVKLPDASAGQKLLPSAPIAIDVPWSPHSTAGAARTAAAAAAMTPPAATLAATASSPGHFQGSFPSEALLASAAIQVDLPWSQPGDGGQGASSVPGRGTAPPRAPQPAGGGGQGGANSGVGAGMATAGVGICMSASFPASVPEEEELLFGPLEGACSAAEQSRPDLLVCTQYASDAAEAGSIWLTHIGTPREVAQPLLGLAEPRLPPLDSPHAPMPIAVSQSAPVVASALGVYGGGVLGRPPAPPTLKAIARDVAPLAACLCSSVTVSVMLFPVFTVVRSSGALGCMLPFALFTARMVSDIGGRVLAACGQPPMAFVTVVAAVKAGMLPLALLYLWTPPKFLSDVAAVLFVCIQWVLSGLVGAWSFMLLPRFFAGPDSAAYAGTVMSVAFQGGTMAGLALATVLEQFMVPPSSHLVPMKC